MPHRCTYKYICVCELARLGMLGVYTQASATILNISNGIWFFDLKFKHILCYGFPIIFQKLKTFWHKMLHTTLLISINSPLFCK